MVRAPAAPVRDYPAIARKYAADVVAGSIAAGKSIRLQCQRFLDELAQADAGLFPYRFDDDRAARPCRFIEKLPKWMGGIILTPVPDAAGICPEATGVRPSAGNFLFGPDPDRAPPLPIGTSHKKGFE